MNVSDENKKYNQFKDKITHYGFKKNVFGGYIMKELVIKDVAYHIVYSSNKVKAVEVVKLIGFNIVNYYTTKEQQIFDTICDVFEGEEFITQNSWTV